MDHAPHAIRCVCASQYSKVELGRNIGSSRLAGDSDVLTSGGVLKYVSIRSPLDSSGDLVVQGVKRKTKDKTSILYYFLVDQLVRAETCAVVCGL